jgi:uncharacterized protein YjbI with pentapeptide repeats
LAGSGEPADPLPPDVPGDLERWTLGTLVDADVDGLSIEGLEAPGAAATGVRIAESRIVDADLSDASMDRASLRDVEWVGGTLANARVLDGHLRQTRLERVRATGLNCTRAQLHNVVFAECRLDLASFRASTMERVRFEGCRLEDADFFETTFSSVVFVDCDLRSADWSGVTFTRSELRGCELTGGTSLDRLRGVRMPWDDVIRSAGEIAIAAGIEIVE